MRFTGERLMPEVWCPISLRYLYRYLVLNRDVSNVASLESHGLHFVADELRSVVGDDISDGTLLHAFVTKKKMYIIY